MVEWLNDTMLLEVNTMTEDDVKAHIENVKSIVEQYKGHRGRLIKKPS